MLHNRYALRHFITTCVRFYFRNELPSPITLPENSSQWKDPEFYEVYSGCAYSDPKLDKEFITIPGGSAYSTTGYYATLKSFKLMKREVTTLDYKECVNAGACRPTYSNNEFDSNRTAVGNAFEEDAKDYCKWIGGRVPTYIEWMYAASYGKDENEIRIFPWGNRFPDFCVTGAYSFRGWSCVNGKVILKVLPYQASIVGCYPDGDTYLGLQDMGGNVLEWVFHSAENRYTAVGGAADLDMDFMLLYGKEVANSTNYDSMNIGIRCAMDVEDAE